MAALTLTATRWHATMGDHFELGIRTMFKRFSVASFFSALLFVGLAVPLSAEEPPSMMGVWRAVQPSQTGKGFTTIEVEFRFTEQKGPLFRGTYVWRLPKSIDVQMNDGTKTGWSGEERVLGVIGYDNRSVTLVDDGDTGQFQGRLVNDNVMELVYFEPGQHAAISRGVVVRQETLPEPQ
jgi:hypothetical protein